MTRQLNAAGLALLHASEQWVGHAYPDPYSPLGKALQRAGLWRQFLRAPIPIPDGMAHLSGKPWTLGWGFTSNVAQGDIMTRAQGDARLQRELESRINGVLGACTAEPNENELAAMVVLTWNIGLGWQGKTKPKGAKDGFRQSTVLRCHNAGDKAGASRAFRLWNEAQGEKSDGLTARRAAEAALYLTPAPGAQTVLAWAEPEPEFAPLPQADAETKFSASPINRSAITAGATAGVAAVAEVARTVADVKSSAESLGAWLVPILLLVVVGLCGYVVWQRVKQRRGGWA